MNLKRLKTFLILAEQKSFTKTASILGCAQSGVTTHIRLLEHALGVRLFERIGKHVTLTAEGERLLPYARKMLSLSEEIGALYQRSARLVIGVSESVAVYLFGDILKEFSAVYPDTEIFLKLSDGRDFCQMLCDGEIDLAVVLDTQIRQKSIRTLLKRKETILLAAASTHELSGRMTIQPEDFKKYPLLFPPPECAYRKQFEQTLYSEGVRPKIALEAASVSVIKESSLCGIGLGLLPEFSVRKELVYHMLEKIHFPMDYRIYTQILIHKDKWISPDLEQFIGVAERHLDFS